MKRKIIIAVIIVLIVLVTMIISLKGCVVYDEESRTLEEVDNVSTWIGYIEYRDKVTGVHYFRAEGGGMILRVNTDGTPYVD